MKVFAALVAVCVSTLTRTAVGQPVPAPDLRPIARVSASEVLLDMVVLDKHGRPVKNLKAGDIEIFEDDVRQQITSFRFVPPSAAPRQNSPSAAATLAQAASRPLRTVNLVCLVFHNLDPVARVRAFEVAREFLKNDLPPETYIGLFVLDDRLSPVIPFTNNRQEVAAVVEKAFSLRPLDFGSATEPVLTANPSQLTISTIVDNVAHAATTTFAVKGGEVSPTVIAGAEVSTDIGANALRGTRATEARDFSHISGMRETDKISNMVSQFGKLPGRKVVLLLSTGFATSGDPELFESIVSKANDTRTTVYAIDVSGLTEVSTAHAADLGLGQVANVSRTQTEIGGSLSAAKEKSRQGDTMNKALRASDVQAGLRALAEGSGGFLVANTNEFRKPLQRLADEMDTRYEATYRPSSAKYDGRLRTIRIQSSHPDWRVESRTGYFAMPVLGGSSTLLPYEIAALAVLDSKPLPHDFDLHSQVFHFRSTAAGTGSALVLEIPGTALTAAPAAVQGRRVLHSQILALIRNEDGQVVDKFSVDAPYDIPDEKLPDLRTTPFVYTHPLDLPPGRYTAQTLLMDRSGGRASVESMAFEAPGVTSRIGMSSALLIRRLEPVVAAPAVASPLEIGGKRLVPFIDTTLAPGTSPYAYFVVYPNQSNPAKPKVQVEFLVDGLPVANQVSDLPAPDSSGAISMMIRAAVHTGRCTLKITASQGNETATRSLAYTVVGK